MKPQGLSQLKSEMKLNQLNVQVQIVTLKLLS
jgi:hypothetical protein